MKASTWADAFGNWHAEITETGIGDVKAARECAERAIAEQLADREGPGFDPRRMTVKQVAKVGKGDELITEYVEQWPDD